MPPKPPEFATCPSCGTKNNARRLQCVKCGGELPNVLAAEAHLASPSTKKLNQQVDQVAGRILLIVGLCGAALFAIFLIVNTISAITGQSTKQRLTELCESTDNSPAAAEACFRRCDSEPEQFRQACFALAEVKAIQKRQAREGQ